MNEIIVKLYPSLPVGDYEHDLNLMWRAEELLFNGDPYDTNRATNKWLLYRELLGTETVGSFGGVFHATAAQRLIAFLKTHGYYPRTTIKS